VLGILKDPTSHDITIPLSEKINTLTSHTTVTMTPSLEHVFTMRLYTAPEKALVIPQAKSNAHRIIAFLTHGHVKGSDFEAELLPGGADWILVSI
jgi:hypothetical protein